VNEARFAWDKVSFSLVSDDASKLANGTDYPLNTGITSVGGFPTVTIASFSPLGGWRGRPVQFTNPYYDLQDSVSYLAGKHTSSSASSIRTSRPISISTTRGAGSIS